jgi:hypothetical protein
MQSTGMSLYGGPAWPSIGTQMEKFPMKLDRIISVCMRKDLSFWRVTAPKLLENVDACIYEVIVPDDEVALFRRETPSEIQVVPEVH